MKIIEYLPPQIRKYLEKLSIKQLQDLEEIRLRAGLPLCLRMSEGTYFLEEKGGFTQKLENAVCLSKDDIDKTLMILSKSSFYALDEELRRGYITLPGGHRAGLCGHAVLENGHIKGQRDICSINLRVAKNITGCAEELLRVMMNGKNLPPHTLIISPPGCGKTTLLRDIAASLSDRYFLQIGIVDERSEIAATGQGKAQFWVGSKTDVLDACPKAEGMMLMLRSMSPQVLICDEIGRKEDMQAISEAVNAGVKVIATAHAGSRQEILSRPVTGELIKNQCFELLALYSRRAGPGTLEQLWNEKGEIIMSHK